MKRWLIVLAIVVLLLGGGTITWALTRQAAVVDPFDAKTLAATNFTLFYPTKLPPHFKIDPKSVALPQPGVVVFIMRGPNNQHIYMSQESRPSSFDFGGYYKNFNDLKETVINDGVIAVGRINNDQTEIGSLATGKTWVIVNTVAPIPLSQLTDMLNSLAVSH